MSGRPRARPLGVLEQRDEALAVQVRGRHETGQLDDRRIDVEQLDGRTHDRALVREAGRRHDQGNPQRLFEERVLA
jgi:hypothetical protein